MSSGEIVEEAGVRSGRIPKPAEQAANRLGLVVSELSEDKKRELKLPGGCLSRTCVAERRAPTWRPGDIILALISKGATTEVKSVDQFNKLLAHLTRLPASRS